MKSEGNVAIINNPVIVSLVTLGNGSIRITWSAAVGADKYIIKRSAQSDGPFEKIGVVPKKFTTFLDETVDGEGTYWYKICAWKKTEQGTPVKKHSKPAMAEVIVIKPPVAKKIKKKKQGNILFTWEASADKVDGYVVLRRYDFMKKPIEIARVQSSQTEYTDTETVAGQLYHYSVQGYVSSASGANTHYGQLSEELSIIRLDAPKVLKVKCRLGKKVDFYLRLTSGANGYVLYKSDEKDGDYTEVSRTDEPFKPVLSDIGEKKKKTAFYKAACVRKIEGGEFIGHKTEPVEVKYKF